MHPALYHHYRGEDGKLVRRYVPTKGKQARAEAERLREGIERRQAREAGRPQLRRVKREIRTLRRSGKPVPVQLLAQHELLKRREARALREAEEYERKQRGESGGGGFSLSDVIDELTAAMERGEWP